MAGIPILQAAMTKRGGKWDNSKTLIYFTTRKNTEWDTQKVYFSLIFEFEKFCDSVLKTG